MANTAYYIGLMSGTSADAVDAVLVDFSHTHPQLVASLSTPITPTLRQQIHTLASPGNNEIDLMGKLDQQLGQLFAQTILQLLAHATVPAERVIAIGSHGQTIRHRPPSPHQAYPFTLQIGDPNVIAELTGITTVADFRRRDMAAGGHGAPLVPAFHRAIFHDDKHDRAIVNIGGMANITWLPAKGEVTGFDTGPGNALMDAWILKKIGHDYDKHGDWAASGQANDALVTQLLEHVFFRTEPPKSTGREDFNLAWLESELATFGQLLAPADIQASLLQLTVKSIAYSIQALSPRPCELFVCGGGAYNLELMKRLQQHMGESPVISSAQLGIAPEWVEAMAFAWLAQQTMHHKNGNLCSVTGANREVILGGVYFA